MSFDRRQSIAEILAEGDPKGHERSTSGGWLGKSLVWVGYLVFSGVCSVLWPNSISAIFFNASVLVISLGWLAASMPYPWYRKFLDCGVLGSIAFSLAYSIPLLITLTKRQSEFALAQGGAVIGWLVAALGLWLLRKSTDAAMQGKGRFLSLFLVWAFVAGFIYGFRNWGDWVVGALLFFTVWFGVRSSKQHGNQAVTNVFMPLARWAGYAATIGAVYCLFAAWHSSPTGPLFGLWDWLVGETPLDWLWRLFGDPRFGRRTHGFPPFKPLLNCVLYLVACVGLGWLASRLFEYSASEDD